MRKSKRAKKAGDITIDVTLPVPIFDNVTKIENIGPDADSIYLFQGTQLWSNAGGIYPSVPSNPQIFPARYSTAFNMSGDIKQWSDFFSNPHTWEDTLQGMVALLNGELLIPHDPEI